MSRWKVDYLKEAEEDISVLDKTQLLQVLKAVEKVSQNPLPQSEGGYGKALGNRKDSKLAGYFKIKIKRIGIRIVYGLIRENKTMRIVVVSVRKDNEVYKLADIRIDKNHRGD